MAGQHFCNLAQEAMGSISPGPCTLAFLLCCCAAAAPLGEVSALLLSLLLLVLSMVILVRGVEDEGVVVVVMMLKEASLLPNRLVWLDSRFHRLGGGHILS